MKNEVLCAAKFLRCELLDVRPSALDYAIQDITHELTNSVMCELEKGELICSLENVEQHQLYDLNSVKIIRKVRIERLVRCKDCKYGLTDGTIDGFVFCLKPYTERGNAMRRPDWFCADGEEKNDE